MFLRATTRKKDGKEHRYFSVVENKRISVSLATVEFKPAGAGTRMLFTEQAVFLDDYDDAGGREKGTRALMEKLEAALQRQPGTNGTPLA